MLYTIYFKQYTIYCMKSTFNHIPSTIYYIFKWEVHGPFGFIDFSGWYPCASSRSTIGTPCGPLYNPLTTHEAQDLASFIGGSPAAGRVQQHLWDSKYSIVES